MTKNYKLVIDDEKGRLDKVIAEKITDLSRTKIKELVNDKNILVNNKAEKVLILLTEKELPLPCR